MVGAFPVRNYLFTLSRKKSRLVTGSEISTRTCVPVSDVSTIPVVTVCHVVMGSARLVAECWNLRTWTKRKGRQRRGQKRALLWACQPVWARQGRKKFFLWAVLARSSRARPGVKKLRPPRPAYNGLRLVGGRLLRPSEGEEVQGKANPLFPALRSGPTAGSGAIRQKQIPGSTSSESPRRSAAKS